MLDELIQMLLLIRYEVLGQCLELFMESRVRPTKKNIRKEVNFCHINSSIVVKSHVEATVDETVGSVLTTVVIRETIGDGFLLATFPV